MRLDNDKLFAFRQLDEYGRWIVYFDPSPKLDGYFYYESIKGFIDSDNAKLIVDLLINNHYHSSNRESKNETT